MEDFYNAMTTYINSKKPKCQHERTFYWQGWETCLDCCLCLRRVFYDDPYCNVAGYNFTKPKEDSLPKIKETMTEVINSVTREKSWIMIETMNLVTKEKSWTKSSRYGWDESLKNELPLELMDHWNELCLKCAELEKKVKCHKHSLCAAVLWEKVKSLYPDVMTLTKFSKKVGVSVPTIIKILKKI